MNVRRRRTRAKEFAQTFGVRPGRLQEDIPTRNAPGAAGVLNVWTNVFRELPR